MIYERYHTREMNEISGVVRKLPALGFFAVFFVLSSVALPGMNGFVSEFLVLIGTFVSGRDGGPLGPWYAGFATLGMILSAVYLLYWTGRVIYGPLKMPAHQTATDVIGHSDHEVMRDLSVREWCVLTPLAVAVLIIGLYPAPILNSLRPAVESVRAAVLHPEASRQAALATPAPRPALLVAER
jgi:NADH-quinone oxidoreductase subunit M